MSSLEKSSWGYLLFLSTPLIFLCEIQFGSEILFLNLVLHLIIIPLLDWLVGKYPKGVSLSGQAFSRWIPYAYSSLYILGLIFAAIDVSHSDASWGRVISVGLALGLVSGNMILCAHEFCHHKNKVIKNLGHIIMHLCCYSHFTKWHIFGHHRLAATKEDNSTSFLNESLFQYLWRTIKDCYSAVYYYEKKKGYSFLTGSLFRSFMFTIGLCLVFGVGLSINSVAMFLIQAIMGIYLVEAVSYIQHYGLLRSTENGKVTPYEAFHTWDSSFIVSNYYLLDIALHADHHLHPSRAFYNLSSHESSLEMPLSYPHMILLAGFPDLWFRLINPMIETHLAENENDKGENLWSPSIPKNNALENEERRPNRPMS